MTVESQVSWARSGSYLTRNIRVKREANLLLEGWQIIGWDPVDGAIRSRLFDSDGGFSEGRWICDGERWLICETGFTPEGNRIAAEHTISRVGVDRFSWESNNRTLDGLPLPGIGKILARRVKGN